MDEARRAAALPIIPDEVRRIRLEPGERLIVRVADFTPEMMGEYQEYLQAEFPDNRVHVLLGEEVVADGGA